MDLSIASHIVVLRKDIEASLDPSRERSLALTKLEECEHWLNVAPKQKCDDSKPVVAEPQL